jgi:hypothetical protein
MTDGDLPGKKTFSYAEAVALLPEVRRITEEAHRKVEALGGPPPGAVSPSTELAGRLEEIVAGWARALAERGVEVKGLWLVDFDNGSGYYCWKYPEDGLHYFHGYEDGFRGRMRIQ